MASRKRPSESTSAENNSVPPTRIKVENQSENAAAENTSYEQIADYGQIAHASSIFTCTFEDFHLLCLNKTGVNIFSPEFSSGLHNEFRWKLWIQLGRSSDTNAQVALHLTLLNDIGMEADVDLTMSVDELPLKELNLEKFRFSSVNRLAGSALFIDKQILKDKLFESQYNKVKITCQIRNARRLMVASTVQSSNSNLQANLFENLFEKPGHHDFTLMTEDRVEFKVHKAIIANGSANLATALKLGERDAIKIGLKFEVLREILRFVYCKRVKNLKNVAQDLLVQAAFFKIEDLKSLCLHHLCESVNAENAVQLLKFAQQQNLESLKLRCIHFIAAHGENIVNDSGIIESLDRSIVDKLLYSVFLMKKHSPANPAQ